MVALKDNLREYTKMKKQLKLSQDGCFHGSYTRNNYLNDTIYSFYQYKEITAVYSRSSGRLRCSDRMAELLLSDGLITKAEKSVYDEQLRLYFTPFCSHNNKSVEQIYSEIYTLRLTHLGISPIKKEQYLLKSRAYDLESNLKIDQRDLKEELFQRCEALLFILTQPELSSMMKKDIQLAVNAGKQIFVYEDLDRAFDFSNILWDQELQTAINKNLAGIFFYGEDGLLCCKNLLVDAIVHAIPTGYYTHAVTNQFGTNGGCIAYIPAGLDITKYVTLTERTRLTYWHLAKLCKMHGKIVYSYTLEELYQKYPHHFVNIYENNNHRYACEANYPFHITEDALCNIESIVQFDRARDQSFCEYLNSFRNLSYFSSYFDEVMNLHTIPWSHTSQQTGIMVHAVEVNQVSHSWVINCENSPSLRIALEREFNSMLQDTNTEKIHILSNFLFFLTPKLSHLYNNLRDDRPAEQITLEKQHLDYMLLWKDGKRVETFPLFKKACIALRDDGKFLFFNFRLGGGEIRVNGFSISWTAFDVDSYFSQEESANYSQKRVCVYTPYCTIGDESADASNYKQRVGENRLNIVIIQDQILCIRRGDVILPSIGVVISLNSELGNEFLATLGLSLSADGYAVFDNIDLVVELDKPENVSRSDWDRIVWAYGGGLSLILDGSDVCSKTSIQHLRNEGWLSPLSRQTQESEIHKMDKHPRTAIGTTRDGSLVVIVYSGRIRLSTGADYSEMITIAHKLFPHIQSLMNVDGGGSSMLGISINGDFMELSYPASSIDSCAGMARPINTALCLEIN